MWMAVCFTGSPAAGAEDIAASLCKEQMQTIYKAAMEYVKDNNGYLPPTHAREGTKTCIKGQGSWFQALGPYLAKMGEKARGKYMKNKKQADDTVFVCPANPYWYGGFGPHCLNYAWNYNLGLIIQRPGKDAVVRIKPVKFAELADPAETILMVDAASVERTWSPVRVGCGYYARNKQDIGFWHAGKANVLFADGRVEALSPEEIKKKWFQIRRSAS